MPPEDFEFDIGQSVRIKANSADGIVRAQYRGRHLERSFSVQYVDNANTVVTGWFEGEELAAL